MHDAALTLSNLQVVISYNMFHFEANFQMLIISWNNAFSLYKLTYYIYGSIFFIIAKHFSLPALEAILIFHLYLLLCF